MSSSMVAGSPSGPGTEVPGATASTRATQATRAQPFRRLIIRDDRCKGCELCVAACPTHVLALDRERVNALGYHPVHEVLPDACTSCALCAKVCPDAVFTVIAPPSPRDRTKAPA
jgi:2-oxoglutarate ferredoxin oxidoreductase subunit delta